MRLRYHVKAVHLKIKDYQCNNCDQAFSYKHILEEHVNSLHLKIKDYNCDECEYAKRLTAKHFTSNKIIKFIQRRSLT